MDYYMKLFHLLLVNFAVFLFKDKVGISKSDPYSLLKNLDGINGIGYVVR